MRAALRSVSRGAQQFVAHSVQSLTADHSNTNHFHSNQLNLSNVPIGPNQLWLPTIDVQIASEFTEWQKHLESLFMPVGGEDSKMDISDGLQIFIRKEQWKRS